MKEYVLILPIRWAETRQPNERHTDNNVLLVLKDKPAWQKGRLNLLGGKVEPGETPEQAAIRELKEESGFSPMHDTDPDWGGPALCGKIIGVDCIIHCFNCNVVVRNYHGHEIPIKPRDGETEKVAWYQFWQIKNDPRLMPNLKVIIPLLFMDVRGWTITDQESSLDKPVHEVSIGLDIQQPFQNG